MKVMRRLFGILATLLLLSGSAFAQQQYPPIPDFSGPGAGFNFRSAINQRFGGQVPILPQLLNLYFNELPAEQNGIALYCIDCQQTPVCQSGGSGALVVGQGGAWFCGSSFNPAAPGPIGGTTPSTGVFTALTGPIGASTPNTGKFTTIQTGSGAAVSQVISKINEQVFTYIRYVHADAGTLFAQIECIGGGAVVVVPREHHRRSE